MKSILCIISSLFITSYAFADGATTEYIAAPIIITAEVDDWETDSALQLPIGAPTELVTQRVDLTKIYDEYVAATISLNVQLAKLTFMNSTPALEMALAETRHMISEKLMILTQHEVNFMQSKDLFVADKDGLANRSARAKAIATK